jgi:undecaprenyl-diphosphatase
MVILATVPALVAGALFSKFVKTVLYGSFAVIGTAWLVGGLIMLTVERVRPKVRFSEADRLPTGCALTMGCAQALALIPGVSRSGGTIVAGMFSGVDRPAAFEFSFFLAMPTMAAAFAHDLWEVRHSLGAERGAEIAVGFVVAFLASAVVVRPSLNLVRRSGFVSFAWYRIVTGLVLLAAIAAGWR